MSFITYKQADSRWGSRNYNGSSSMAAAGCGPTSCAIIISGMDPDVTPIATMKYMQSNGYAIRNNGTAWNGIPSCLKAFGVADVQNVDVSTSMAKVWELMKKGYVGVFLFSAGSRGGITWTTSGHYMAVTDYKYENGKHYVYTRDPGGRNHTGWHCYETQMRGLIPRVWLGDIQPIRLSRPTGKYSGVVPIPTIKKGSKGSEAGNLQKFLNWYLSFTPEAAVLKVDSNFGAKSEKALRLVQAAEGLTTDGIYGNASFNKVNSYASTPVGPNGRALIAKLKADTTLETMTTYVGQSLAIVNAKRRAVFYSKRDGSAQKVKFYDDKDKTDEAMNYTSLGHCNGACLKSSQFYVCSYYGKKNTRKITVLNAFNLERIKSFNLPVAVSGIAYDAKSGTLVGSKGSTIYIFNAKNKVQKKFTLKYKDGTAQDIMAHNKYVYVCRSYVSGSISCIDKYDFNGQYIGSYTIAANELESCDVDEYGYIHYLTWNKARLIKTTTRV